MLPLLSEIKNRRHGAGLTQTQLAGLAEVSQSLVAKIESGRSEAAYGNVKKIFDALEELERRTAKKVSQVMNKKIIFVNSSTLVAEAVQEMRRHKISQLPVFGEGRPVGSVSEKEVLDAINETGDANAVFAEKVGKIMGENYPQLDEGASLRTASLLLHEHSAVIVTKSGKPTGIVTKADILKN